MTPPVSMWEVGGATFIGEKDLAVLLGEYAHRRCRVHFDKDARKELQQLAWFLGVGGNTEACKAIMEHAFEPTAYHGYGVHGHYGP